jgi:hypothetical protein
MPMRAEEEGVDAEEEEEDKVMAVAVALFELGAGSPLTDRSSPQMVDEVPGVAEAHREVGGGGVVLILGNMLYLLPYLARALPPLWSPRVLLPPSQQAPRLSLPPSPRAPLSPLSLALPPLLPLPRVPGLP